MARKANPEKLKFVIYARKSSEGSERQVASIPDQKEFAKKVVKENHYKVVARFEESASASKVHNRPEFDKMVKLIENGEANAIICWHTNRLARNPLESGLVQQLLFDGKIQLIHTSDSKYTPKDSGIMFGVEASMNAEYSRNLSRVVSRGIRSKNKNGGCTGVAPQGYLNAEDPLTHQRIVVKDPERWHIVKKLFELYLTGHYSVPEITSIANNEYGYRTIKRLKTGGNPLMPSTVNRMLENPFYMGKIRDMDDPNILHDGSWEPIITEEQYYRIQRMKSEFAIVHNLKPKVKVDSANFELKGLMRCASCGCSIVAEAHDKKLANGGTRRHIYYKCTQKSPYRKCQMHGSIKEEEAFRQIYELLDKYTIHPVLYEWSKKIIERIHREEIENRYDIANMQHTTLTEYERCKDRLIDMYVKGMVKEDVFEAKNKELDDLIEKTKQANKAAQDLDRNWYEIVGRTLENLKDPKAKMDAAMDVGEKRAILQSIGPNVLVVERKIGKSANGRDLTAKFIEVKPYPWLEFLEKSSKKLAPILSKGLTNALQGEIGAKNDLYSVWLGMRDSNPRMVGPEPTALPLGESPTYLNYTTLHSLFQPNFLCYNIIS